MKQTLHLLLACALLAVGGALLLPVSRTLQQEEQEQSLRLPPPDARETDALGQQLYLFTLGGLRSLSAEILALDATTAWTEGDWPRLAQRWKSITTLCPHRINYWVRASRDMHVNAASALSRDRRLDERERVRQSLLYLAEGERFLHEGIANNPTDPTLYARLGDLYSDVYRRPQYGKAVDAYREAIRLGASAHFYERQVFYNLCRIRGREQEAWALGRRLYENERQRVPSLLCLLYVLENRLGNHIPAAERLSLPQLFGSEAKARRQLARFEKNRLNFPTHGIGAYLRGESSLNPHP